VDDAEKRRACFARFQYAQTFLQIDPWAERVSGKDAHEFVPMRAFPMQMAAE
jgi:nitrite reductase (NADH) large subunit